MRGIGLTFIVFLAVALFVGCGKDREETTYRNLTGKVSRIDLDTGVVEMTWYNEKKKREQTLPGRLAPDAEILIDGATARLEDVRIDDVVTVNGRVERRGGETQLVATKVEVQRQNLPTTTGPAGASTAPSE